VKQGKMTNFYMVFFKKKIIIIKKKKKKNREEEEEEEGIGYVSIECQERFKISLL
jgi:hypothetical protein